MKVKLLKYMEVRSDHTGLSHTLKNGHVYFATLQGYHVPDIGLYNIHVEGFGPHVILVGTPCAHLAPGESWTAERPNYDRYITPKGLL